MGALDSILEFVEDHPKPVAISLLGVIASGSIGGGLLIRSLEVRIETQQNLTAESKESLEKSHKEELEKLEERMYLISNQIEVLGKDLPAISEEIRKLQAELKQVESKQANSNTSDFEEINRLVSSIESSSNSLDSALKASQRIFWMLQPRIGAPNPGDSSSPSTLFWLFGLVSVMSISLLTVLIVAARRR